jgi:phosphopantothenate synthetase
MEDEDIKPISYDINECIIKIINNVLNNQIPNLIHIISVKENIDKDDLTKTVNQFNKSYQYNTSENH